MEYELNNIQIESQGKVQGLMVELAAFKKNQDMMMVKYERFLKQLEIFKSNEENFKISLNDLKLKLTVNMSSNNSGNSLPIRRKTESEGVQLHNSHRNQHQNEISFNLCFFPV